MTGRGEGLGSSWGREGVEEEEEPEGDDDEGGALCERPDVPDEDLREDIIQSETQPESRVYYSRDASTHVVVSYCRTGVALSMTKS